MVQLSDFGLNINQLEVLNFSFTNLLSDERYLIMLIFFWAESSEKGPQDILISIRWYYNSKNTSKTDSLVRKFGPQISMRAI